MRALLAVLLCGALIVGLLACSDDESPTEPPPSGSVDAEGQPSAITDLRVQVATSAAITLVWTAPGVPGDARDVAAYDLRRTLYGEEEQSWNGWTTIDLAPPAAPGSTEQIIVDGLVPGSTWVFRLRSRSADTWSTLSPHLVASAHPQWDQTPPDPVDDLAIRWRSETELMLWWSPSGDDGPHGDAEHHHIRLLQEPVTETNWDQGLQPQSAAVWDERVERWTQRCSDLMPVETVYVAARAEDDAGNLSAISPVLASAPPDGNIWHVRIDGSGTVPTVADGVRNARPGDLVLVHPGRYTWTNQGGPMHDLGMIFVGRDTTDFTVASAEGPASTILDAEGLGRVLFIQGYNDGLVIEGFTITNGESTPADGEYPKAGGLTYHLTSATVRDCIFEGNHGDLEGGAVYFGGVGTPTLERCVFRDNHAGGYGGAIFAINVHGPGSDSTAGISLIDCLFENNTAQTHGGALCLARAVALIQGCAITNNVCADGSGGGLAVFGRALSADADTRVLLDRCTLNGNEANLGAAIQVFGSGGDAPRPGRLHVEQSIIAHHATPNWLLAVDDSELAVGCTVLFGNAEADTLPHGTDLLGPIYQFDPEFCPGSTHRIQPTSPCLPGGRPHDDGCESLGADDEGRSCGL